ncbi:hypothetical protein KDL01_37040 [Actinospica durhamensis]|uniref:PknH-like extracellular domain-containing protein n=1 Tax=Actinospica durhamensis TaxID=1508375 RepID=A0A941IVA6_9ACTN|nr:hypothetical protein [Actinospica durhamensis]MBR7838933.1 hypothetical protein [Actinospica durhamensis]
MSPPTQSQAAGPSRSPGPLPASTARAVVRVSASPAVAAPTRNRPQLASSQVPGFAVEQWKPVGVPVTRAIDGHDIGENECASVVGASGWVQQSFSGGDGQNVAIQDTFTFADTSGARSALSAIATSMAGCQDVSRALQQKNGITSDAQVAKTAGSAFADAWQRRWTGVMGMSAAGPQINHIYVAVSDSELIVLQFTEFPGQAAAYHTAADPGVLTMLLKESAQ